MNDSVLDAGEINKNNNSEISVATALSRFWAAFIDGLLISGLSYTTKFLNLAEHKIFAIKISVWVIVIAMLYKPLMEIFLGQTVGKIFLKIKVLNSEFEKANTFNIIGRHSINLLSSLSMLFFSVNYTQLVSVIGSEGLSGLSNYTVFVFFIRILISLAVLLDLISIWFNEDRIMIHDKIGKTRVVSLRAEHSL